ncbi:SapC protein [Sphingomonas gellani]|uniref:SapC protein n=1 Tax=Sphingomonas gellani TaxID=1166340 RepID=A0A1H8AJK3_9SPHN|nr:SapC family protein [Sphingomonas gellani]SEM70952.1 SapC protein [Sphingomonas gellani]
MDMSVDEKRADNGPIPLNNVDHAGLRVVLERGSAYGDGVNQCRVFATEFEELQREYAILFRVDAEGTYHAFVPLGLAAGENLFLDGDRWDAHHIPALMQRGPFSIGVPPAGEAGEPMIHIDPTHARISRDWGAPIFLDHGGNAPLLDRVGDVLRRIYAGHAIEPALSAAFAAHDLFEPVDIDVEVEDGRHFSLPDCVTVSQDRLGALDGDALAALHRDDFLRPAVWVASSLANVTRLVDRKVRRDGAA